MQEEEKKDVEQSTPEQDAPVGEEPEKEETAPTEDSEGNEPVAEPEPQPDPEKERLMRELTIARAQLAAVQSDIDPKQAADAVILAVYALEQEGKTPDEKTISKALECVMERHPEWKAGTTPKVPEKAGAEEQKKPPEAKGVPAGKVIF